MTSETLPQPRRRRIIANTLTVLLALSIAALTLMPTIQPPGGFQMQDKAYHAIAFAGLVLPSAVLYPRALVRTVPLGLMLGGAIEIIQPWVGRSGEWGDFVADVLGIGVGILLGLTTHHFLNQRSSRARSSD